MDESIGFGNIGGLQEHIQCMKEMVLFPLIYKDLYKNFKIKPPKGVIFYGPPGTGKTLMARALANECCCGNKKVSFFSHNGAECLSKWVGESEKHLRGLFEQAQQQSPSIIFFDEIDGLAPMRSSYHYHVQASVVSTLLALMDGLKSSGQVIVIGATNRIDAIDLALRRPGRFDKELYFPLPSLEARYEILMVHAKRLSDQICLPFIHHLAVVTDGYCGADLQALCSEAVMCSIRRQYPQMYTSARRINLGISTLRVERRDFFKAKSSIVPAALRTTCSYLKRLPPKIKPLLNKIFKGSLHTLIKQNCSPFLQKSKSLRGNLCKNKESSSTENLQVKHGETTADSRDFCTHFLLVGTAQQGQTDYIAPAILQYLEHLSVTTLDITALFETSGRTSEEVCIQKMKAARQSLPGILYLPNITGWWGLVNDATRALFLTMVRELDAGNFPILLLATAHSSYETLSPEIKKLFNIHQGQVFTMQHPTENGRRKFFKRIFIKNAMKPPSIGCFSNTDQLEVLLCKIPEKTLVANDPCENASTKNKKKKNKKEDNQTDVNSKSDEVKSDKSNSIKRKTETAGPSNMTKRIKLEGDNEEDKKAKSKQSRILSVTPEIHNLRPKIRSTKIRKRNHRKGYKARKLFDKTKSISRRHMLQDDDYTDESDDEDVPLPFSSTNKANDILIKHEKESKNKTVQVDMNRLEELLEQTVKMTENSTLQTILALYSKLAYCVNKYKGSWDRSNLPKDLEEVLHQNHEILLYEDEISKII